MKASEWSTTLPSSLVNKCQAQIAAALLDPSMRMPIDWVGIPTSNGEHDGIVFVSCDALKIGEPGDCVRADVTPEVQQQVLDGLGLQMPTAKIIDLMFENREVAVEPQTFSPDSNGNVPIGKDPVTGAAVLGSMMGVSTMFAHDARISSVVKDRLGLVVNVGKLWVVTKKLGGTTDGDWTAANYGWYSKLGGDVSATGQHKIWQSIGTRHNVKHVDYSQVCIAVHPLMIVDGGVVSTAETMMTPGVASLISHEGALQFSRQPRLPQYPLIQNIAPPVESMRVIGGGGGHDSGGGGGQVWEEITSSAKSLTSGAEAVFAGASEVGTAMKLAALGIGAVAGYKLSKYVWNAINGKSFSS